MSVATVSQKGQITLPARFRKKLGIKPHDRVVIESLDDVLNIKSASNFFELEGFLGKAVTATEERASMMKAIAAHSLGRRK